MVEIEEMSSSEIEDLLGRSAYGHIACSLNDHPYVVPIHFSYDEPFVYIYTTEGKKSEIMRANPEVCLQTEEVDSNDDWKSVIIIGDSEEIIGSDERENAMAIIKKRNPELTPAISVRWMDNWVRQNIEVIFRITPKTKTGRATVRRLRSRDAIYTESKKRSD